MQRRTLVIAVVSVWALVLTPSAAWGATHPAGSTHRAAISPVYLYVDGGCTQPGDGSAALPFCTIGEAAAIVDPGQTVIIATGHVYDEAVSISRSGTQADPITFRAALEDDRIRITSPFAARTQPAITVSGAHDVVLEGLRAEGSQGDGIDIDASTRIVVNNGAASTSTGSAIHVLDSSTDVTISRELVTGSTVDQVTIEDSTGTTLGDSNLTTTETADGVAVSDSPGTIVASNTIDKPCRLGVVVSGASAGTQLVNNVIETGRGEAIGRTACTAPANATAVTVSADAAGAGVSIDGSLIDPASGSPLYSWAGTTYTTVAGFTARTSQGVHDLAADPELRMNGTGPEISTVGFTAATSAFVDSAVDSATRPATDFFGRGRADDPDIANAFSSYADRGAFEAIGGVSCCGQSFSRGPGPLDLTVHTTGAAVWTVTAPIALMSYTFGGGVPEVRTDSGTVNVTYPRAGDHCVHVFQSTTAFWTTTGASTSSCIVLGAAFTAVPAQRVLDTRHAVGVGTTTALAAGGDVTLTLPQIGDVPIADVTAVTVGVTVTGATQSGHLDGQGLSVAHFTAGRTASASTILTPGAGGTFVFHNGSTGAVQVVVDLEGYFSADGSAFAPVRAKRVLDTRHAVGTSDSGPIAAGGHLGATLASAVPAGATAAVLTVTAADQRHGGYLSVLPTGQAGDPLSVVHFGSSATASNVVVVPVTDRTLQLQNVSDGPVDAVIDVTGFFGPSGTGATQVFVPYGPSRVTDTRHGDLENPDAPVRARHTAGILPAFFDDCATPNCPLPRAYVDTVTATGEQGEGTLTVFPWAGEVPTGPSTLHYVTGQATSGLALPGVDTETGQVAVYNGGAHSTDVIVDELGYFVPLTG